MPWTVKEPPPCAVNWTEDEKRRCIAAANARLAEGGEDAEQQAVFACIHAAGKGEKMGDELKATWSTALVNTFPDSSFLFIEQGGEKDEDGKTKPRSLRHFPYRNAEGAIDLPHLRNAIARIPQSNAPGLSQDKKDALQKKAQALLEKENAKLGKATKANWPDDMSLDQIQQAIYKALETLRPFFGPRSDWDSFWVREVYADHAIVSYDGNDWMVDYAVNEDRTISLAALSDWQAVEQVWQAIPLPVIGMKIGARHSMKDNEYVQRIHDDAVDLGAECKAKPKEEPAGTETKATYAVKSLGENRIGGYGILFGSEDQPDLSEQRDFFTKATDFWLDKIGPTRPIIYHHAQEPATAGIPVVGLWNKVVQDDIGVWLEGELDKAHKYRKAISELVAKGALALSSDSAPHLVLREKASKGTHKITRWPLLACSLTPTPAEPRLQPVDFETIKAAYKAVGIALPVSVDDAHSVPDQSPTVPPGDGDKSVAGSTEREAILRRLLDIATS